MCGFLWNADYNVKAWADIDLYQGEQHSCVGYFWWERCLSKACCILGHTRQGFGPSKGKISQRKTGYYSIYSISIFFLYMVTGRLTFLCHSVETASFWQQYCMPTNICNSYAEVLWLCHTTIPFIWMLPRWWKTSKSRASFWIGPMGTFNKYRMQWIFNGIYMYKSYICAYMCILIQKVYTHIHVEMVIRIQLYKLDRSIYVYIYINI